jgi:hypothetical protein
VNVAIVNGHDPEAIAKAMARKVGTYFPPKAGTYFPPKKEKV